MCMIVAYKGIVRVLGGIWCECVDDSRGYTGCDVCVVVYRLWYAEYKTHHIVVGMRYVTICCIFNAYIHYRLWYAREETRKIRHI